MDIQIEPIPKSVAIEDQGGTFTIYDVETHDMITYRGKDLTGLDMFPAWNICHELDLHDRRVWRPREAAI